MADSCEVNVDLVDWMLITKAAISLAEAMEDCARSILSNDRIEWPTMLRHMAAGERVRDFHKAFIEAGFSRLDAYATKLHGDLTNQGRVIVLLNILRELRGTPLQYRGDEDTFIALPTGESGADKMRRLALSLQEESRLLFPANYLHDPQANDVVFFELIPGGFILHGKKTKLPRKPWLILKSLCEDRHKIQRARELKEKIWEETEIITDTNVIDHVCQLRKHLRNAYQEAGKGELADNPVPCISKSPELAYEFRLTVLG